MVISPKYKGNLIRGTTYQDQLLAWCKHCYVIAQDQWLRVQCGIPIIGFETAIATSWARSKGTFAQTVEVWTWYKHRNWEQSLKRPPTFRKQHLRIVVIECIELWDITLKGCNVLNPHAIVSSHFQDITCKKAPELRFNIHSSQCVVHLRARIKACGSTWSPWGIYAPISVRPIYLCVSALILEFRSKMTRNVPLDVWVSERI